MYFHLMCRVPCFPYPSEYMNADDLTHHLAARNLRVTDSRKIYVIDPQLLIAQLCKEVTHKTLQTAKGHPMQVHFRAVPSSQKDVVNLCAITQVDGKDGFFLFSSSFKDVEFFAKRKFPLIVW